MYNKIITMAIVALCMEYGRFVNFNAAWAIFVVCYQIMKIFFGSNADGKDEHEECGNKLLYGRGWFQRTQN